MFKHLELNIVVILNYYFRKSTFYYNLVHKQEVLHVSCITGLMFQRDMGYHIKQNSDVSFWFAVDLIKSISFTGLKSN